MTKEVSNPGYLSVDMVISKKWENVAVLRDAIKNIVSLNITNSVLLANIEMSVSELLENAIKYSAEDCARLYIEENSDDRKLHITVKNSADNEKMDMLKKKIEKMKASGNSLDYYIDCMRGSKEYKKEHKSAGCGLARIYHEAGGEIIFSSDENYVVLTVIIDLAGEDEGKK